MIIFLIALCIVLFVFSLLVFAMARLAKKWADADVALSEKAFSYLWKDDEDMLRKKLKEIDDLYVEIATSDAEVSVDVEIIEKARELLVKAIND